MTDKLKQYFPMLRTQEELLSDILGNEALKKQFQEWEPGQQQEFIGFCTGVRGIKPLYDSFFKELLNPEYHRERLEELLTLLIGMKVTIREILPNDTTRIADESALLVTDIVVALENGELANLEIQKIGYAFPGARAACYSADLLLRQYKRVKSNLKKNFSYRDIKTVYTIVLFEKSTQEFHTLDQCYIHRGKQVFDTGLSMDMLQKYIFVSLDNFRKIKQNKDITNKLDAWLTFLCVDEPEQIIRLIHAYPEFKAMYEEAYNICLNVEDVMRMFSKELRELDRNTVQYMIEEQQELLEDQKARLVEQQAELHEQQEKLGEQQEKISSLEAEIQALRAQLESKGSAL